MDKVENNLENAIINCQMGQLEDFGLVYDAYIKKMYVFVYQKTVNREIAEDLTSKTFLNALKNINHYDKTKANFNTWLYRIARNNIIDHYRAKKDEVDVEGVFDLAAETDVEVDMDNFLLLQKVRKQLEKLKPRQREIILLKLWDGLSYKEISGIMGISADNAKMIFCRSIFLLREDLAKIVIFLIMILNI